MTQKKITIRELAAGLSLSPTTVSLVLSGKGETYRIAAETRRRIEEAADRLGYRPNHMARSMRRGKTDTIGVVFPDVSEAYMNRILSGIETVALGKDVSVIVATSSLDYKIEARNLATLLDRQIDGLLLVPYAPFHGAEYRDDAIRQTMNSGIPTVAIDRHIPEFGTYGVIGADRDAARQATKLLIKSGCRRPAYLGFDLKVTTLEERRLGFYDAVEKARLSESSQERLLTERNPDSSDIRDWLAELSIAGMMPDGFLVSSEGLALKLRFLLEGIQGRNRGPRRKTRPPLIARFGEDSPYFPTGMISVRQPHEELGRRAAEKLFSLIAGKPVEEKDKIEVIDMEIFNERQPT